ncbi:MAG: PilZ domain-containing protein [Acidobacteria bacterium]|jgi:hypothetical protein|nr:PilZ domain-containing protein [Acidobacteriota bacterium]
MHTQEHVLDQEVASFLPPRRFPRFALDVAVTIHCRTGELLPGRALDISERGMAVTIPVQVPVGEVVALEFEMPLERISVAAIVRNRKRFRYGLEFIQPNIAEEEIKRNLSLLGAIGDWKIQS